ncbi:MAG TPA: hypothetical protein VGG39_10105 [Polyangiaceae bacterium]|jgi:hypothetical protein
MNAHSFEPRQEEDVVASRRLVRIGIGSVVVGALGVVAAAALLVARIGAVSPDMAAGKGPAPAPRAISNVEQTPIWQTKAGEDLRAEQRRRLTGWGWVDRDAGVARIPIDRAMDVVVGRNR